MRRVPFDLNALRTVLAERGCQTDERVDNAGRGRHTRRGYQGAPGWLTPDADGHAASVQQFDPGTQPQAKHSRIIGTKPCQHLLAVAGRSAAAAVSRS